jgi:hypothetical protein
MPEQTWRGGIFGGARGSDRPEIVVPGASTPAFLRRIPEKWTRAKSGAWKLPQVWKPRTLPHLLGNHRTVSTSFHTLHRFCLSIGGGQF